MLKKSVTVSSTSTTTDTSDRGVSDCDRHLWLV